MSEKKYLPETVRTYDELVSVFDEFHVDSNKTRFYVGQRYEDPKAFVIYRDDNGEFEVYKMKADGSKAVRYRGMNEFKAVDEFYRKFISEVAKRPEFARKLLRVQRQTPSRNRSYNSSYINPKSVTTSMAIAMGSIMLVALRFMSAWVLPIVIILSIVLIFMNDNNSIWKKIAVAILVIVMVNGVVYAVYNRVTHSKDGYYVTDDGAYYRKGHDYYYYDNGYWTYYGNYHLFDSYYYDDYTYYDHYYYNDSYDDFYYSDYYDDYDDYDYDYDYDYDSGWDDNDSWDSWDSDFDTDWDSDW